MKVAKLPRLEPLTAPAGATAAEWSEQWFGGPMRINEISINLGTTSQQILPNNPKRLGWIIQNNTLNAINFSQQNFTNLALTFSIGASGGYASMKVQDDGEGTAYAVFAAAPSGTGFILIKEMERV